MVLPALLADLAVLLVAATRPFEQGLLIWSIGSLVVVALAMSPTLWKPAEPKVHWVK